MARRISDSVVFITEASSGIGPATAPRFVHMGATVVVSASRQNALHQLADHCERLGAEPSLFRLKWKKKPK
jgi:NADP-dependent 3-hydroxy acid dehydrogenase YdfG